MSSGDVQTERRRDHLAHQIGFAERWLRRAQEEVAQGDLGRSQLTLMLAEAEVHHARSGGAALQRAATRPSALFTILGAAGLAAALLAGLTAALPQTDVTGFLPSSPPVIRFRQPVGSTLAMLPMAVAPAVLTQATSAPPQVPVITGAPRRLGARRPTVRAAAPTRSTPVDAPAPVVVPQLVSDGDLIDLVLAAERSLRAENR